jgi:predicted translin family RNA/ssDNA-binding protein
VAEEGVSMSRDIQSITNEVIKMNNDLYKKEVVNKDLEDIKKTLKKLEEKIENLTKLVQQNNEDRYL